MYSHLLKNESQLYCNGWRYFLLLTGFTVLIAFTINYLFLSDVLFYQSFGEQLAIDRIAKIIVFSKKIQWIGYLLIPLVVLIRITFTAICIYIGCFISNVKINFGILFKIALVSDFVFVLAGIIKLIILIFFKEIFSVNDLQFQPLSLMEIFDKSEVDALVIYPLSLVSVFEAFYWLVLAWLLSGVIDKPFGNSLKTVASTYGIGLLLWVLFAMFLTVNLN